MNSTHAAPRLSFVGSAQPPAGEPVPSGPIRLTQRGRLIVLVLFAAVMFLAGILVAEATAASGGEETSVVTVSAGDTLWDIALAAVPEDDPRETIEEIHDLNPDLGSSSLRIGQQLVVPSGP